MFRVDKALINPNIARTIRFTPTLFDWIKQVSEREDMSFNQVVLQCCKNAMEEDCNDVSNITADKPGK